MDEIDLRRELMALVLPAADRMTSLTGVALESPLQMAVNRIAHSVARGDTESWNVSHLLTIAYPGGAPAEFWATPLGQAIFGVDAFPSRSATKEEAKFVLRVSHQRLSQLVKAGWLDVEARKVGRQSLYARWRSTRDNMEEGK